ncbi:MAG: radical SAM protein [bacterium]
MNEDFHVINKTTSFCPDCCLTHPARYEQKGNAVYFIVDCPQKKFTQLVSTDAELFRKIRAKANYDFNEPADFIGYRHINLIEITNDCNFQCKFCFCSSNKSGPKTYKPLDEIIEIGKTIKKERGYEVTLTGGEPTLHRQLLRIIRGLKKLGLMVNMASNGYLLAKDPGLARALKKNGLSGIGIQLDSIDTATHKKHRNNTFIEEKIEAFKNCQKAGLRISAVITVTRYNLKELGLLIQFCLQFRPHLNMVILQPYFPTGYTEIEEDKIVNREETLRSLESYPGLSSVLSSEFFWPIPRFRPLSMEIHPDCGVMTAILIENGGLYPLDDFVDRSLLYKRLASYTRTGLPGWISYLTILYLLFTCAYKGKRAKLLRSIHGFIRSKGDDCLVLIEVEQFMYSRFQDEQRAIRCGTAYRNKDGIHQQGCIANRIKEYS